MAVSQGVCMRAFVFSVMVHVDDCVAWCIDALYVRCVRGGRTI